MYIDEEVTDAEDALQLRCRFREFLAPDQRLQVRRIIDAWYDRIFEAHLANWLDTIHWHGTIKGTTLLVISLDGKVYLLVLSLTEFEPQPEGIVWLKVFSEERDDLVEVQSTNQFVYGGFGGAPVVFQMVVAFILANVQEDVVASALLDAAVRWDMRPPRDQ